MNIMSWNVNGLRAVMKKGFMDFLEKESPDVLGLQEVRLQEDQMPKKIEQIDNYYKIWNFGDVKGYSGTAIFSKEKPLSVKTSMGEDRFDREGRTIIAEYENFTLINCYFPNGKKNDERLQFKLDFYDKMFEIMEELRNEGKNVVVCGDYNTAHKPIDLKNPNANKDTSGFLPIERKWLDKLIENDYIDTFREYNPEPEQYSWWTYRFGARKRNAGWRIDYFFVNKKFLNSLTNAYIRQDIMGSDHCPIGIEIK